MLTDTHTLQPVMAGLRATDPHGLSFAPTMEVRAFVLEREEGDVVVYSAPASAGLGGVTLQLLGHWHEPAVTGGPAAAPVVVGQADTPWMPDSWHVDRTIDRRTLLGDDLWAIPIPGHTPGSTAYLWDSGRRRFLFTGDTVYLDGDEWVGGLLESSDREAFVESLGALADLDFDVLVPWVATRGRSPVAPVSRDDARRRLEAIRKRVWRGEAG